MKRIILVLLILLAFLLTTDRGANAWQAAFVIPSLLPENRFRMLELVTKKPQMMTVEIPHNDGVLQADLYLPENPKKILMAIHGANEAGKDDPRIINFGQTFTRAGIATLIPTFPNITREKFTPQAAGEIKASFQWLSEEFPDKKLGMVAFSVAAGPMFIASADEEIKGRVDYLVSFGGYHELKEVLRNITTGENRDPFGLELISRQYADLFGPDENLGQLLDNTDPERFDELFEALPAHIKQFVEALTPSPHLADVIAEKIFLIHGDPDFIIPLSESQKLKQALGQKAELTILKIFSHVNVQLPSPTIKNLAGFYIPEAAKLYRLVFRILQF